MKQIEYLLEILESVKNHLQTKDTDAILLYINQAVSEKIQFESQDSTTDSFSPENLCIMCGKELSPGQNFYCCSTCADQAESIIEDLCPDCKGSGQDIDGEACLSCNATGLLTQEDV